LAKRGASGILSYTMGVYTRFKRDPEGMRKLVELLETTPLVRRKKMIDIGMVEDPEYTKKAMELMMTFEDVMKLPPLELAEVLAKSPSGRTIAFAFKAAPQPIKDNVLKNCKPQIAAEVKDQFQVEIGAREIGGAQLKMIEIARKLERAGLVKSKKIP